MNQVFQLQFLLPERTRGEPADSFLNAELLHVCAQDFLQLGDSLSLRLTLAVRRDVRRTVHAFRGICAGLAGTAGIGYAF